MGWQRQAGKHSFGEAGWGKCCWTHSWDSSFTVHALSFLGCFLSPAPQQLELQSHQGLGAKENSLWAKQWGLAAPGHRCPLGRDSHSGWSSFAPRPEPRELTHFSVLLVLPELLKPSAWLLRSLLSSLCLLSLRVASARGESTRGGGGKAPGAWPCALGRRWKPLSRWHPAILPSDPAPKLLLLPKGLYFGV